MVSGKLEWKVIQVKGHELEMKLNQLSDADIDIFTVERTGEEWTIIARKALKEESSRGIGFRKS